jgi:hypothetical protein
MNCCGVYEQLLMLPPSANSGIQPQADGSSEVRCLFALIQGANVSVS